MSAQLGVSDQELFPLLNSTPMLSMPAEAEVTPFHAVVGQPVTITWHEENKSTGDLGAYFTDVYVEDSSGTAVGSVRLDGAGVAAGASVDRSWEFPGGETEGQYSIKIWMNSEGSDPASGPAGAQGFRSLGPGRFGVGATEEQADEQDSTTWITGFQSIQTSQFQQDEAKLASLGEGVNWLAADESLTYEQRTSLGTIADGLRTQHPRALSLEDNAGVLDALYEQASRNDTRPEGKAALLKALSDVAALHH